MNGNQSSGTVTEVVQQIEEKKQQHCYMHYSLAMRAIKSSADVLCIGLAFFNVDVKQSRRHRSSLMREFRKHFGASCAVLAEQWNTLLYTSIEDAKLSDKEASVTGFRIFLMAHHFLWDYPSNAVILGRRFKVCESYASGPYLWKWIEKIAALKVRKIVWPKRFNDSDAENFIITVDGTDCAIWEPKHDKLPKDKRFEEKEPCRREVLGCPCNIQPPCCIH
jgi:hypothetical protein